MAPFTATCFLVLESGVDLVFIDVIDVSLGGDGVSDRQAVSFAGTFEKAPADDPCVFYAALA